MVRKILGTITARILIAVITLVTILINGWFLGADKVGIISLIILAITLIQMLNNFVGGSALVYLYPRTDLIKLFVPAYIWSFFTSFAGAGILILLHRIPEGYFWHVLFLSLILSLSSVNFMILMGQERIRAYNIICIIQAICFFVLLMFWIFILHVHEVISYLVGLYTSYLIAFAGSLLMVMRKVKWGDFKGTRAVIKEIFRYGTVMQLGNIFQFFNYRLSYYFIEFFMGIRAVGVYTMGVQLSESLWLVSRSIHLVQYSRISNESDEKYAARLTVNLTKFSFLITFISLCILYLLLILVFPFVFKPEFEPVKLIMAVLSFGILTFSLSIILSPFFSGIGKPRHNTISAAIGLFFTLISGWFLIPRWGYAGAAISASLSYSVATLYQFIVFIRISKLEARDFLLKRQDLSSFILGMKEYLSRSRIINKS
jgi:O-antigen/teichoic acid export membrane protein